MSSFEDPSSSSYILPESSRDSLLLKSIEDDLSDMRAREERLVAEIAELKAEMNELKIVGAPVPANGNYIFY
jgi:hypothetical protein